MDTGAQIVARAIRAAGRAWGRKWSFLAAFALVLAFSTAVLATLDLLPSSAEAPGGTAGLTASVANTTPAAMVAAPELPEKITIPRIGVSAAIANSPTTDIETLDHLLLAGAVRYPASAKLNENGNVVLFGHSSYLPIVRNPAYKTFDDIQKLHPGDIIMIYSADAVYTYAVRTVAKENVNVGAIALAVSGKVLTLATCNSFATKDDRFVVTADFVESHPLGA